MFMKYCSRACDCALLCTLVALLNPGGGGGFGSGGGGACFTGNWCPGGIGGSSGAAGAAGSSGAGGAAGSIGQGNAGVVSNGGAGEWIYKASSNVTHCEWGLCCMSCQFSDATFVVVDIVSGGYILLSWV